MNPINVTGYDRAERAAWAAEILQPGVRNVIHEYITDVEARLAFAKRAADNFAANPKHWSFTDGDIEPGALLALRWGLGDDCVLVLQIGDLPPTVYGQAVRGAPYKSTNAQEGIAP